MSIISGLPSILPEVISPSKVWSCEESDGTFQSLPDLLLPGHELTAAVVLLTGVQFSHFHTEAGLQVLKGPALSYFGAEKTL